MTTLNVTFIGTATMLLEVSSGDDTIRLLTDPVFDPPGREHRVGNVSAFAYTRLDAPAIEARALPPIDAVLLSHDHHRDNLDASGRQLASTAGRVLTTLAGERRLTRRGLTQTHGLAPWHTTMVRKGTLSVTVTATPARHGPIGTGVLTGPVIGFLVEWQGQRHGGVWISGDTLWHRALHRLAGRVSVAFLHLGAGRFRSLPWLRFSMNAADAVAAAAVLQPRSVVPIHFEGWSHFSEDQAMARATFERAGLRTTWLEPGRPTPFEV
jgi:L-ascorbate metabolism protein UlaG (beta-lactamase superfamily)